MSLKSIVHELKGIKNGMSKWSAESKHWLCRPSKSHIVLDVTPIEPIQQGQWATLPPELLLDIIRRVRHLGLCVLLLSFVFRYVNHGAFPISLMQVIHSSPIFGSNFIFPQVFYVVFPLCV
jgi:hypothetical protein